MAGVLPRLGLFTVLAVAVLTWLFRWGGPIDLRYDAGVYYTLGTSLATGAGYRILAEPGAPEAIQYPPGLPALVAVHQWILNTNDAATVGLWLKRTYAVLFLALAIATLALACRYLGPKWGTLAAVLCLLQINTYFLSNLLFTELPYTLVSVCLALVLTSERFQTRVRVREAGGFVLATLGFCLRTAGLALLIAWVGEALLRRQWRLGVIRAVLALVPVVAWNVHVARVQKSDEYRNPAYAYQRAPYQFYNVSYAENLALVDPFKPELGYANVGTFVRRLRANLAVLPVSIGEMASEARGFWSGAVKTAFYPGRKKVDWADRAAVLPLTALAVLAITGWIMLLRRRAWFPAGLIVCAVALVCTTPWPQQFLRYLAPLGPFIAIVLVMGLGAATAAVRRVRRKSLRVTGEAGLIALLAGALAAHAFAAANSLQAMRRFPAAKVENLEEAWSERRWFYYDQAWQEWDQAVGWIAQHAPRDAIVATSSPHLCYLMSGRRAVMPPMEADPEKAEKLLADVPASYVIVDQLEFMDISRRYGAPAVAHNPERWELVQRFNKTLVYQRSEKERE